jgi:hypothetical protein
MQLSGVSATEDVKKRMAMPNKIKNCINTAQTTLPLLNQATHLARHRTILQRLGVDQSYPSQQLRDKIPRIKKKQRRPYAPTVAQNITRL